MTTAIITKSVIRDAKGKRTKDSNNHSSKAIKLLRVSQNIRSDGYLKFTRFGEQHMFPVKHHKDPTLYTVSTKLLQVYTDALNGDKFHQQNCDCNPNISTSIHHQAIGKNA